MKNTHVFIFLTLISISLTIRGQESSTAKENRAGVMTVEATALIETGTPEALKQAIIKLEEAAKLFVEIGKPDLENYCVIFLGNAYHSLGDNAMAVSYFQRALTVSEKNKSDPKDQVMVHMMLAGALSDLGEIQKAIDHYEKILSLNRETNMPELIATSLMQVGQFYASIGEHERAIVDFKEALPLSPHLKMPKFELALLKGIADSYGALNENEQALKYYNLALTKNAVLPDKMDEGGIYNGLGLVYSAMGENETALRYYNDGIRKLDDKSGNKNARAHLLGNIAAEYAHRGRNKEAAEYYNQALALFQELKDGPNTAAMLSNMAGLLSTLGERQKAIDQYQTALAMRDADDKSGIVSTLVGMGTAFADIGDYPKATERFLQAFPVARSIKDRQAEALTLANLAGLYITSNPRLAVLFGKMSGNIHQQIRRAIMGLDSDIQRSYLRQTQITYKIVPELLIRQNRMAEAFEAVDIARNQQDLDITPTDDRTIRAFTYTPRENRIAAALDRAADKVADGTKQVDQFRRRQGKRRPDAAETTEIEQLQSQKDSAIAEYVAVIRNARNELERPADKDDTAAVTSLAKMQRALAQFNDQNSEHVATVYTIMGKERFTEIVITADGIHSATNTVSGEALHKKARDFVDAMKTLDRNHQPAIDVTDQARELYNLIFKPIVSSLPNGVTTIMWSLDSGLSYVPIAALHDGTDYLIRRKLNNVVFTRSDPERFTRPLSPVWRATAFAASKPRNNVKNLGASFDFPELVAVRSEVNSIVKGPGGSGGVIPGQIIADAEFTRERMLAALLKRNPVVHISSHFTMKAGDAARSFLLLGDGTPFSLADMRRVPDLFGGIDLLTLSACNTGIDEPNAEGREVDGFAELAQRLGAASVVATIWSVNECSTAEFMKQFYRHKIDRGMTKGEALRQAQLDLLSGTVKITENGCRRARSEDGPLSPVAVRSYKSFKFNQTRPFEHPYYWSPFILYGNWK